MLKIENLVYRYKNSDKDTLKGLHAEFEAGKFNVLLGPSGSGKSTLLSLMAGLDRPASGRISVDDTCLSSMNLDEYRRARIAMIFQAFQLFPLLTAVENVCYPMEQSGIPKPKAAERAKTLLESVGIQGAKHKRFPANLSGGEQQRVAIARALSAGARVILADEPTGNLDVANGEAVIDILKSLAHKQGYCVIVVTHDLDIAEIADVTYKMSDGVFV